MGCKLHFLGAWVFSSYIKKWFLFIYDDPWVEIKGSMHLGTSLVEKPIYKGEFLGGKVIENGGESLSGMQL